MNADPADIAGDWGFIRVLVDGVESDAVFNGAAMATTISAGPNPRPVSISAVTEFDYEHIWPDGEVDAVFDTYVESPPVTVSLDLSLDGSVTIKDAEGELNFEGMISPSAKLLVATSSDPRLPSPDEGELDEFIDELDGAVVEWLVGVKRTRTPEFSGKTYRIIRQGWWSEGDAFEIDFSGENDRLVFNASGTSVARTSEFNFESVPFDGVMESGDETISETMSVAIGSDGGIMLEGGVPGDYTLRSFGFAQEGSKLLILIDAIESVEDEGEAAGLGMIIAIEEP